MGEPHFPILGNCPWGQTSTPCDEQVLLVCYGFMVCVFFPPNHLHMGMGQIQGAFRDHYDVFGRDAPSQFFLNVLAQTRPTWLRRGNVLLCISVPKKMQMPRCQKPLGCKGACRRGSESVNLDPAASFCVLMINDWERNIGNNNSK